MADVIVSLVHDALGIGADDAAEQSWQDRALCAQTDPEAFFPEKGGSTREAKRVCRSCEVRAECLEYALGHDERIYTLRPMMEHLLAGMQYVLGDLKADDAPNKKK